MSKRLVRFNTPGDAHGLTFSCQGNLPLLDCDRVRWSLAHAIEAAKVKHDFEVWAYVIMPNHAHMIVKP